MGDQTARLGLALSRLNHSTATNNTNKDDEPKGKKNVYPFHIYIIPPVDSFNHDIHNKEYLHIPVNILIKMPPKIYQLSSSFLVAAPMVYRPVPCCQ